MKRGSSALRSPISGSTRLASIGRRDRALPRSCPRSSCRASGFPAAALRLPAPAISRSAEHPTRRAIMPSRCWAAQHMPAEYVWISARSRYSQSPASGVNACAMGLFAQPHEPANSAMSPERGRRWSQNICAAVITTPIAVVLDLASPPRYRSVRVPSRDSPAMFRSALGRLGARRDAGTRRDPVGLAGELRDDIDDEAHEAFHRLGRAEAIERGHREERIAQPGDSGNPSCAPDSAASGTDVVSAASTAPVSSKLQSLSVIAARITACLPVERNVEVACPGLPVLFGELEEFPAVALSDVVRLSSGPSTRVIADSRMKAALAGDRRSGASVVTAAEA